MYKHRNFVISVMPTTSPFLISYILFFVLILLTGRRPMIRPIPLYEACNV